MSSRIGHLHGGHSKVAATASIPSKYQTIVVGNNEKKGFNSGSKRSFDWQKIDESPGPAKYSLSASFLDENSTSFSKKGLGGFVSKVRRLPVSKECSVGPAQYNPQIDSSPHDFNKAKCTSNFHLPIAMKRDDAKKFQTPAPNQYHLSGSFEEQAICENKLQTLAAGFMSRSKRDHFAVKSSSCVPAPGTYNICEKWTSVNPRVTQAPFKSTTERMLLPKSAMLNPGPGTYDPYEPPHNDIVKNGFTRKHYLCIAAPAIEMPPENPSPGPGQYDLVNYKGPPREQVSSSMFVSTTDRWRDLKRNSNPGPGTYDPNYRTKQSFIYNRNEKWI